MNRLLQLSLLLFLLSACNSTQQVKEEVFEIVDDEFVVSSLDIEPVIFQLDSVFPGTFEKKTKAVENKHRPNITDTLVHLVSSTVPVDEFRIYKSQYKSILTHATLRSDRITLAREIQIGITKSAFVRRLEIKDIPSDIISISELEGNLKWTFYFNSGRLDSSKFQGYLD
jgi:hypothetical protein